MKLKRRKELKRSVLLHISNTIKGELLDWDNLEVWLDFEFINEEERDIATDMFRIEADRLDQRIG
jgi:hypothetical protein